jgi:hypothetical protein
MTVIVAQEKHYRRLDAMEAEHREMQAAAKRRKQAKAKRRRAKR